MEKPIIKGIAEFQTEVADFCKEKGFNGGIEERMVYLTSEIGEMAKEVLKLISSRTAEADKESIRLALGLEIYDCIWNLVDVANKTGVNLSEAFERKMEMNKDRVW